MRPAITAERLRELLHYDPLTGLFTWRVARSGRWGIKPGDVAGCVSTSGYRRIRMEGAEYYAHRLAVLYMTGAWPKFEVDHIDANRSNNAWANLRDIPHQENTQNVVHARSHGTTGVLGAHRDGNRFAPRLRAQKDGARIKLGTFETAEEAHAAFIAAKRTHHPGNTL